MGVYLKADILTKVLQKCSFSSPLPHMNLVVECRTPERDVGGSKPTAAMLCPWARHFTPRKYWLITQELKNCWLGR